MEDEEISSPKANNREDEVPFEVAMSKSQKKKIKQKQKKQPKQGTKNTRSRVGVKSNLA